MKSRPKRPYKNFARFASAVTIACLDAASVYDIAYGMTFDEILDNAAASTDADRYPIDDDGSSSIDRIHALFGQAVYNRRPEIFLTCSDWDTLYYQSTSDQGEITRYLQFTDTFRSRWNDEAFTENFWSYIDSVIASAGISADESEASKIRKAAIFIGRNYSYDFSYCEASWKSGQPFFTSLTEQAKSFCLTDARLMMACCYRMGIPCNYLEGYTANGDYHAWNRVCVNGSWTEVDVSFARKASNKDRYIFFSSGRPVSVEIG